MAKVDIKTIAKLANIGVDEAQIQALEKNFEEIRQYFAEIVLVDTSLVAEEVHQENVVMTRADEAVDSGIGLHFSPYLEDGYFKVPKVIE